METHISQAKEPKKFRHYYRPKETVERGRAYFAANLLTIMRAGLSFAAASELLAGNLSHTAVLLALAVPTELDGRIARAHNVSTNEGAARDLLADGSWFTTFMGLLCLFYIQKLPSSSDEYFQMATGFSVVIVLAMTPGWITNPFSILKNGWIGK